MTVETFPFDAADYLTDEETIAEYLTLSLESGDDREIAQALQTVVRARGGVAKLAGQIGIEPDTLTRMLTEDYGPSLGVVLKVMQALGVKLSASKVA